MLDDAELLRRYADQRAQDAFAEVVRRHLDAVYSTALRRVGGDSQLAEDVAQQVFVALAHKAAAVARHPILAGWLYITTRNEAANVVRSERRRKAREQQITAMRETLSDQEPDANWGELAPMLDTAIDDLNEADRRAVLLRFVDRRNYSEIGVVLRLSEDAARMRVDRALEKLRRLLARRGITSTASALGVAMANHAVGAAPVGLAATVTATAVAVAPAALVSAVTIIEFMSTTKAVAAAVGLVVVAALGTATREVLAWRQTQATLAATRAENAAPAAKLRDLNRRVSVVTREAVNLQALIDAAHGDETQRAAKSAAPVARAATSDGRPSREALAAGQAFVERHPAVKKALLECYGAQFETLLGSFYRSHPFTPAQREQFDRFLMMDGGVIRQLTGVDGTPLAVTAPDYGNREKRRQLEQELRWMGEQAKADLQQCLQAKGARRATADVVGTLFFTPTPLTGDQADQVARIMTGADRGGSILAFDWNAITANAAGVLSAPQHAVLRGFAEQYQQRLAINEAMRRNAPPQP